MMPGYYYVCHRCYSASFYHERANRKYQKLQRVCRAARNPPKTFSHRDRKLAGESHVLYLVAGKGLPIAFVSNKASSIKRDGLCLWNTTSAQKNQIENQLQTLQLRGYQKSRSFSFAEEVGQSGAAELLILKSPKSYNPAP